MRMLRVKLCICMLKIMDYYICISIALNKTYKKYVTDKSFKSLMI